MQEERYNYIRKQAIMALELTKGFTPEQRNAFSNTMKTVEEFSGYILELTNAQHPAGGNVWVKASLDDRTTIPMGGCLDLFIKYDNGEQRVTGGRNLIIELLENGWIDVQWLNEQPVVNLALNKDNARYELRLAIHMLLKAFKFAPKNKVQHKYYDQAEAMLIKHSHITDVLRTESNQQPVEQISQDAHEKEVMMKAFGKVRQLFEGRQWIMEGRGSYLYNDDRYREEVRYMYDEFNALVKDTWANIKSNSSEYRQAIIAEYLKGEQKENEAVLFLQWVADNGWKPRIANEWAKYETIYSDISIKTTAQLYNEYQKQNKR
jgi:hypothetical protein